MAKCLLKISTKILNTSQLCVTDLTWIINDKGFMPCKVCCALSLLYDFTTIHILCNTSYSVYYSVAFSKVVCQAEPFSVRGRLLLIYINYKCCLWTGRGGGWRCQLTNDVSWLVLVKQGWWLPESVKLILDNTFVIMTGMVKSITQAEGKQNFSREFHPLCICRCASLTLFLLSVGQPHNMFQCE